MRSVRNWACRSDRPRANRPTRSAPMRRPKAISSSRRLGRSATNSSGRRRANWPGSRRRPAATRWCRPPRSRRRNSWSRPSSRSPRSSERPCRENRCSVPRSWDAACRFTVARLRLPELLRPACRRRFFGEVCKLVERFAVVSKFPIFAPQSILTII